MAIEDHEPQSYLVLINNEEQFSLWPKHKMIPTGWRAWGFVGTREECVAHVNENWIDMRPLSLRKTMDAEP